VRSQPDGIDGARADEWDAEAHRLLIFAHGSVVQGGFAWLDGTHCDRSAHATTPTSSLSPSEVSARNAAAWLIVVLLMPVASGRPPPPTKPPALTPASLPQ
jgi:hypothetical protein